MSDLPTDPIADVLGDERWAADRIAGLSPAARRLYALILYRFTESGPPDRDELSALGFGADALSELVDGDLVQLGADAQIAVAYPLRAQPADAAVVVARAGDGCAAGCACPHINFFGSTAAAERFLAAPELHGTILDLREATAVGRRAFGDLLDRLGASARR